MDDCCFCRYDAEYAKSLEVLTSISESLMVLLKNVSIDGEAKDQQIVSTGITDRNIDDYLGIIEQRIDDLIQMSSAAVHSPLMREDFLRMALAESHRHPHSHGGPALRPPPTLPSLTDADDDDVVLGGQGALGNTATTAGSLVTAQGTTTVAGGTASQVSGNPNVAVNPALSTNAEDPARVQPINIALLKEYMAKKMNKQGGAPNAALGATSTSISSNNAGGATPVKAPQPKGLNVSVSSTSPTPMGPNTTDSTAKKALAGGLSVAFDTENE